MGLLDWLTDGTLGSMGGGPGDTGMPQAGMPPGAPPAPDAPPIAPQQPAPPPNPTGSTPPADATVPPQGQSYPAIPLPQPRPAGADAAPPTPPALPAAPPAPPALPAAAPAGPPVSLAPDNPAAAPPPYKLGDQTGLGKALGIDPKSSSFNNALAGLGGGLTAAGNSKGKSPGQAFASGAGGSLDASTKETHAANKDAQGYLTAAIAAKKAGDDAAYKTNYNQYLAAKLKVEQDKAAKSDAVVNKNDSPTQLYLAAQRNVAADPLVKGAYSALQNAQKTGTPADVQKAQATYEQTVQERQAAHLAGVGLHPQSAADIAKQPGMTQANPVNAATAGITKANIGQKLQPGQYYTNPADGKVYQFTGTPSKSSDTKSATPAVSKTESPAPSTTSSKSKTAVDDEDDD